MYMMMEIKKMFHFRKGETKKILGLDDHNGEISLIVIAPATSKNEGVISILDSEKTRIWESELQQIVQEDSCRMEELKIPLCSHFYAELEVAQAPADIVVKVFIRAERP